MEAQLIRFCRSPKLTPCLLPCIKKRATSALFFILLRRTYSSLLLSTLGLFRLRQATTMRSTRCLYLLLQHATSSNVCNLGLPPELTDACISYLADDRKSLLALSYTSYTVRELTCRYLFQRLKFQSGIRTSESLQEYISGLDALGERRRIVKSFVVASGPHLSNPRVTKISLCTIRALMDHFPRLEELDLECFTWQQCTHAHDCLAGMVPRPFARLTLAHVRIRGNVDPLEIIRCISSLKRLIFYDALPTAVVNPLYVTSLASLSLKFASLQILMDCRTYRQSSYHIPAFPSYYDTHPLWYTTLFNCQSIVRLQLTWTLSHSLRGEAGCLTLKYVD